VKPYLFWLSVVMAVLFLGTYIGLAHVGIYSKPALIMGGFWVIQAWVHADRKP
jgi:hypothetical protein